MAIIHYSFILINSIIHYLFRFSSLSFWGSGNTLDMRWNEWFKSGGFLRQLFIKAKKQVSWAQQASRDQVFTSPKWCQSMVIPRTHALKYAFFDGETNNFVGYTRFIPDTSGQKPWAIDCFQLHRWPNRVGQFLFQNIDVSGCFTVFPKTDLVDHDWPCGGFLN